MEMLLHTATILFLAGLAWGDLRARVKALETRLGDHIREDKKS